MKGFNKHQEETRTWMKRILSANQDQLIDKDPKLPYPEPEPRRGEDAVGSAYRQLKKRFGR